MSRYSTCLLLLLVLPTISAPAIAETQNKNQTQKPAVVQSKPAVVQSKPAASQQLNYGNQGTAQRNHVFDGTKPPNNPVQANTAPKPSPVGQPASQYRPQQTLHTNPVPSPVVTRSTTTPTVTRSSTTTTATRSTTTTTQPKKP